MPGESSGEPPVERPGRPRAGRPGGRQPVRRTRPSERRRRQKQQPQRLVEGLAECLEQRRDLISRLKLLPEDAPERRSLVMAELILSWTASTLLNDLEPLRPMGKTARPRASLQPPDWQQGARAPQRARALRRPSPAEDVPNRNQSSTDRPPVSGTVGSVTGKEDVVAAERRLTGRQLLALQLLSRGYTPGEIASFTATTVSGVLLALDEAGASLGVTDWRAAVSVARARGLVL
jgi:hypothetical protein